MEVIQEVEVSQEKGIEVEKVPKEKDTQEVEVAQEKVLKAEEMGSLMEMMEEEELKETLIMAEGGYKLGLIKKEVVAELVL